MADVSAHFERLAPDDAALRSDAFADALTARDAALARIRGRAFSTFALIGEEEFAAGLARAEAELPETLEYESTSLSMVATLPG